MVSYKVVIVDDHRAVSELVGSALAQSSAPAYTVVGRGVTGREAVELCRRHAPDLLLLDLMLPDFSGVEVLTQLRPSLPEMGILFFSACRQRGLIAKAVAHGADGYVLKEHPLQTLLAAIERVCAGGKHFDPQLLGTVYSPASTPAEWQALSPREQEVARLIAQGFTTKEAAATLGVSVKTLDNHRTNLMRKLDVHDAVSVTRYALLAGLAPLN